VRPHRRERLRVVHEDVDRTECRDGFVDHVQHVGLHGDIGVHEVCFATELVTNVGGGSLAPLVADLSDDNTRSLARVAPRDPTADAFTSTGDDRHSTCQSIPHDALPCSAQEAR